MVFVAMMVINVILFLYYVYFSDYQAQGRYLMPSMVLLMIFVASGYGNIAGRLKDKKPALIITAVIAAYVLMFAISYFGYMIPGCI